MDEYIINKRASLAMRVVIDMIFALGPSALGIGDFFTIMATRTTDNQSQLF